MSKKFIYIVSAIILGAGIYLFATSGQQRNQPPHANNVVSENGTTVTYTNSGYTPQTITIETGTTITFVNQSNTRMWPASDVHPIHAEYPGSNISKCGSDEEGQIFDACSSIESGGSFSFQFNEVGTWTYHDHLNPSRSGTIIVK